MDELENATWEVVGGVGIDSASIAFADAAAVGDGFRLETPLEDAATDLGPDGIPVVVLLTGADIDIPIEVVRDTDGTIRAARVSIVDDLDEITGVWERFGELAITGGECLVADPFCDPAPYYRCRFPMPNGRYIAEAFADADWVLAMRLRRDEDPDS